MTVPTLMTTPLPTHMPVLGRGKHRSAKRGACFMEMASYLAGERWSDHPRCTHPLLASVARLVNDNTPDDDRQELAPLIPSVIGLNSDDRRWDVVIARRALTTALPVAPEIRQRTVAVGLLTCERMLDQLDGRPPGSLSDVSRQALAAVPLAQQWAQRFSAGRGGASLAVFRRRAAPAMVIISIGGIAEANRADRSTVLCHLLESTIHDCTELAGTTPVVASSGATREPAFDRELTDHRYRAAMGRTSLRSAIDAVAGRDPVVANLVALAGPISYRPRDPDGHFGALVRAIVFQQLAGAAANAIHRRVRALVPGELTAAALAGVHDDALRGAGLSANKLASLRDLSAKVLDGTVDFEHSSRMSDDEIVARLVAVRGIGRWTAEMYLMFELRRLDVWPVDDLGVRQGYAVAWALDPAPTSKQLEPLGERFRPYRSVVARYCWEAVRLFRGGTDPRLR